MTETSYLKRGFLWGVAATVAMSILMLIGMGTGAAPMPEPIPRTIVTKLFGSGLPKPVVTGLALILHLGYGGFWGAVLNQWGPPVTVGKGLALGVFLWLVMQVVVLPLLGWGLFGTGITPAIAVATLTLHVVYGGVLGWGLAR